jgi:hypothetical protein
MITTLTSIVNTLVETGVVDFPANYKITDKDHVHVYYIDGETAEDELLQVDAFSADAPNEYKVNAITNSGFNVELRDAYATADGRKISIRRVIPLNQLVEYPPGNDFPGSTHERALDKLTGIAQQFHEEIGRQIGMPLSEDVTETNLPAFIPDYYLALDSLNNFIWKAGVYAMGADEIQVDNIDWGIGAGQVSAADVPIADAGTLITATEVEAALQENRTALDVEEAALVTHRAADGKEHSDVVLNNDHRVNDGSDHSFVDQDVRTTASPTFASVNTGAGANELYPMNQDVRTTASPTFASVNTGNGANKVYDKPSIQTQTTVVHPTLVVLDIGQIGILTNTVLGSMQGFNLPAGGTYSYATIFLEDNTLSEVRSSASVAGGTGVNISRADHFFVIYMKLT